MSEPTCECTGAGFCERYQIQQADYHWKMCRGENCSEQKSEGYRRKWREQLVKQSEGGPSIVQRVVNVTQAVIKHARNNFKKTPLVILEERAKICESNECGFHNKEKGICIHPKCGCPLRRVLVGITRPGKLELASEKCPAGYWNAVEGEESCE